MLAGDGWRYIAQRFGGDSGGLGDFLDFNVPLQGVEIGDVLSGHNVLTGTITPEYPRLKGPDGQPILIEGGTAIWAESPDGEIRGGGLVTHSDFDEDGSWSIECTGLTGTSIELPYDSASFFVNVDPLDLFRFIWAHIQSHPNHNLGMSIDPTISPVRLGTDLVQRQDFDTEPDPTEDLEAAPVEVAPPRYSTNTLWREAGVKALKANGWNPTVVDDALKKWLRKDQLIEQKEWTPLTDKERQIRDRTIDKIGWPPNPPNPGRNNITDIVIGLDRVAVRPSEGGAGGGAGDGGGEPGAVFEYDAYKLNWYSTLDLGAELDTLASSTPFDWHLVTRWDGDEIRNHIRLGYPRLGRRREDLRLVVGENIQRVPSIERDGAEYATEVWVFGAGEGSQMIRGMAFRRDDVRVRKVVTISDPTITTEGAAIQRAEQELAKRFNIEDVAEIEITDHPHAPMGSIDLGDEVFVEGDIGWVDFSAWCRVVGRTFRPDDSNSQILTLIRSDRIA